MFTSFVCVLYLLDPLDQGVLVEGHGLGTLVQVLLVPDAELQDLRRVQPLQTQAAGRRLATQHSCREGRGDREEDKREAGDTEYDLVTVLSRPSLAAATRRRRKRNKNPEHLS